MRPTIPGADNSVVELGVFLPVSGRAAGPEVLTDAAQSAERQGWDAVWSADRVVTPWKIETEYPYAEDAAFIVPPDRPFLDSMTCLAYLAGGTKRIASRLQQDVPRDVQPGGHQDQPEDSWIHVRQAPSSSRNLKQPTV